MLPSKKLLNVRQNLCKHLVLFASYSRKSDSKNLGYYKIVKSNDVIDDALDNRFGGMPNWELFAPKGYRFLLPGSIGPAWHEAGSMVPIDNFHRYSTAHNKVDLERLECTAQECPVLLRKGLYLVSTTVPVQTASFSHSTAVLGVLELFPNNEIYTSQQLTIVTLTYKRDNRPRSGDIDSEYYAKTFIWAAQEICIKLKATGYWADFINPFSGRPYLSPFYKSTLYETDERFRCLGFEIRQKGNCKVIEFQKDKLSVGSLFTNAPANTELLCDILSED